MSKCQCRQILIFLCKLCKLSDKTYKLFLNKLHSLCHYDNISVVTDVTTCCTQVNNRFCVRTLYAVCVNVRHYIVTNFLFTSLCNIIINIVNMLFHLSNLFVCYIKSKFFFTFCKCNPKFSPCLKLHIRRKNILHFFARISFRKRCLVSVIHAQIRLSYIKFIAFAIVTYINCYFK